MNSALGLKRQAKQLKLSGNIFIWESADMCINPVSCPIKVNSNTIDNTLLVIKSSTYSVLKCKQQNYSTIKPTAWNWAAKIEQTHWAAKIKWQKLSNEYSANKNSVGYGLGTAILCQAAPSEVKWWLFHPPVYWVPLGACLTPI